jgi:DNA-binding CsgD family transcriptional regulator
VYAIGGIAAALACSGQWQVAARLFGAAEHLHRRGHLDFDLETWDRQRGLGLPEPWFRADASFGSGRHIRDALWGKEPPPFPPIPDIAAADAHWAEGAAMSLEESVDQALEATIGASEWTERTVHGLSAREVEVLRLLTEGMTDGEIAAALYISRRTAATHVRHIYDKLGVSSRAEAAAWAVRNGIA